MNSSWRVIRIVALAGWKLSGRGRLGFTLSVATIGIWILGTGFSRFGDNLDLQRRLVLETGMALTSLVVLGTALVLGARGLGEGDDRFTLPALASLPVNRGALLAGHLLGQIGTLVLQVCVLGTALAALVEFKFGNVRITLALHLATLLIEATTLLVAATTFSLIVSPVTAFFGACALAILSHAEPVIWHLARQSTNLALETITWGLLRLTPPLAGMDIKASVVRGLAIDSWGVAQAAVHTIGYIGLLMALANRRFRSQAL